MSKLHRHTQCLISCLLVLHVYNFVCAPKITKIRLFLNKLFKIKKNNALTSNTHTHTCLTALFPGLPGWAGTRKVKPIWILLKQEIVSGSGISWAICKSAPRSRQITTLAPDHSCTSITLSVHQKLLKFVYF